MKLRKILEGVEIKNMTGETQREIEGIAYHSKQVGEGFLFAAIRGLEFDGHQFIGEAIESEDLGDAPVKPMPHNVKPMLATLVREPFDHPDWIFEVKWDGYRAVADVRDGTVSLYSRNGISFDKKFFPVVERCGN
jgi:ATP-dependent DNA ligase